MTHLVTKEKTEWREMRLQEVYKCINSQSPDLKNELIQLMDDNGILWVSWKKGAFKWQRMLLSEAWEKHDGKDVKHEYHQYAMVIKRKKD